MLQPKKTLKQLIQNAFKKGTEKSEMKKKMPQVNAEKARFEEKTKVKGTGAASSYQPSKPANDNAARFKAPNATVSKVNFEREKWEKGLSGNVPMGSGSKSKSSSESSSSYSYKNKK